MLAGAAASGPVRGAAASGPVRGARGPTQRGPASRQSHDIRRVRARVESLTMSELTILLSVDAARNRFRFFAIVCCAGCRTAARSCTSLGRLSFSTARLAEAARADLIARRRRRGDEFTRSLPVSGDSDFAALMAWRWASHWRSSPCGAPSLRDERRPAPRSTPGAAFASDLTGSALANDRPSPAWSWTSRLTAAPTPRHHPDMVAWRRRT